MNDSPAAVLRTIDGTTVPLQGVTAHGRLEGLIFELTVEQRYRNDTPKNLEAVFTFPLPLRAVLLGFDLEIGERKLEACAVAKQQASERYEHAIDQGNTAALIEHDGNGLYTVSLGNLMAGENAVIRYRYAELLDAHQGFVRLNVPTVIAPRYGNPSDAGLEGPAIPDVGLLTEYPFELSLDLAHVTNVIGLRSPSHEIVTTVREDGLTVRLSRNGFLDRDFVLELDQAAIPPRALVARDGDGFVALATATLALDTEERRPLALKILLDCSGSMGGDSIAAAKRALLAILDRLKPEDRISLTRFGTSIDHVTEGLEPADAHSLAPLQGLVRRIEADLGGTEMEQALQDVLSLPTPAGRPADVILITDGEIYDVKGVLALAALSHHRLFAIAIGATPNEALARSLADETGGACEFVGPNEDAEAAILRTFKRLRSTPRTLGAVQWPSTPDWTAPKPSAVFPGDTLHLLAGFATQPTGSIAMTIQDARGQGTAVHLSVAPHLTDGDLLPRLAAARRLSSLDAAAARDLAVTYQLATEYTSFVVVAERADGEKAQGLPATVAVPHMLAAGWGATAVCAPPIARASLAGPEKISFDMGALEVRSCRVAPSTHLEASRKSLPERPAHRITRFGPDERDALIRSLYTAFDRREDMPRTLQDLASSHPVPDAVLRTLHDARIECGADVEKVMAAFLAWLGAHTDTSTLNPDFQAMLRGKAAGLRGFRVLRQFMNEHLEP